jgi:hypothetical protein
LSQQEADEFYALFTPIAERLGLAYTWRRDGDDVTMIFTAADYGLQRWRGDGPLSRIDHSARLQRLLKPVPYTGIVGRPLRPQAWAGERHDATLLDWLGDEAAVDW